MAELFDIEEIEEKVILVGVSEQDGDDAEDSVAELAELVKTAGATVVGTMIQKREMRHPGTYIGTGKVHPVNFRAVNRKILIVLLLFGLEQYHMSCCDFLGLSIKIKNRFAGCHIQQLVVQSASGTPGGKSLVCS